MSNGSQNVYTHAFVTARVCECVSDCADTLAQSEVSKTKD